MGIQVSSGTGGGKALFYKINQKDGCFQQGSGPDKVKFEPGKTALAGILKGFKIEENEYEGVKSEEIRLYLADPDPAQPNMYASMTISSDGAPSAFAMRTLAKLVNANFNEPVFLTPYLLEKGSPIADTGAVYDNDVTGVSIKQGGQKLKEDMGTTDNKLPERPTVMVNGKPLVIKGREQKDSSGWVPVLDGLLDRLHSALKPAQQVADSHNIDPAEAAAAAQAATSREGMRARA